MQEIVTPQISEEELHKRIDHLADWLRRIRRERRNAIFKRGLGLIVLCVFISRILGRDTSFLPFIFVFAGGGGALLGVGLLNPLREATRAVTAIVDVRTIEVLLQARHAPDAVTCAEATEGVKQLLPKLQVEDGSWLASSSKREIVSIAASASNGTALAALQALEFVGDAYSLAAVARIAEPMEGLPVGQLQLEARRILPILKARVEAEVEAAKLLRPADAAGGQELLRPASAHGEDVPDHLLRPAQNDLPSQEETVFQRATES